METSEKIWSSSILSRETVKTIVVCESCQYHCDYVTLQFVCFNNQLKVAVPMGDRCTDTRYRPLLICDQTTRFAAQSEFSYEVQEVVIDCVVLFYEEERGGGGLSKEKQV